LSESNLPIDENGELIIQITENFGNYYPYCLVYHPEKIAIALLAEGNALTKPEPDTITQIHQILAESNLAPAAVAGIFAPLQLANNSQLHSIATTLGVPTRFLPTNELTELVLAATGADSRIVSSPFSQIAVAISTQIINPDTIGQPQGKLAIIGTGPGASQWMSPQVKEILASATDLVGYKTYINLIGHLADGKRVHESDNRVEAERAYQALDLAASGKYVAVVSSGDPGIYAMAAAVFEVLEQYHKPEWQTIDIQVAPGISAMQAAAATIGAPLGHDFCVISLSDILKPWEIIAQRITAAAKSDFVIAFYNPVSKERTWQLAAAKKILMEHRKPDTPVVLGRNLGRKGEEVQVTTLKELEPALADMRTVIIIGSSHTRQIQQDHNIWVYTSRRYNSQE
jgi:cobalt-precorrin 5A hydrolase/precorrin-3B C17-methyltransferase